MGVTPGHPLPDISPVKDDDPRSNGLVRQVMSSSPPPMDGVMGSPSKPARKSQLPFSSNSSARKESPPTSSHWENGVPIDENAKFGRNSANAGIPASDRAATGPIRFNSQPSGNPEQNHEDDEDDGDGGFDLAKGFAPIAGGSFASQRSSSIGVARAGS